MDPSKKSRIPKRIPVNIQKCTYHDQENVVMQKNPLEVKASNASLNGPFASYRTLSDTALLPPRKKVRLAVVQPKDDAVTRPPLGDLDKNIANKNISAQKKLENFRSLQKTSNAKYLHDKFTSGSQSTQITNCKIQKPTTNNNFQRLYVNNTTACNRDVTKQTPSIDETFKMDSPNITILENLCHHPKIFASNDDSDTDTIFVDSCKDFLAFKPLEPHFGRSAVGLNASRYISPIKPNVYAAKSKVIFQGIPEQVRKPAKKMTLIHKMQSGSRQRKSTTYSLDIYNMEYLDDIVSYQLKNDWKYVVLKINLLKIYNPCYEEHRVAVVNWLIRAQEYLNLSPTVLFTTIRLFDRVLETISIPCNMCQLVGLVIMWIVNKVEDSVNLLTASKMLALCNGVYSNQDFLKMERKLLAFFNFDLHIPDVTVYIAFYLKKLKINNDLLLHCAFYILECYALNTKFSTLTPSVQAAAAVCLSFKILTPSSTIWKQLKDTIIYYPEDELDNIMKEMLKQLHITQDPAYEYREPYKKYTTKNKMGVSMVLLHKLVAT